MNRFPKILAATCAAVVLSSSLAFAADAPKTDAPAPTPMRVGPHAGMGRMSGHGGQMGGQMAGQMMGPLSQLSPEKQEVARKLMADHAQAMFPLHQNLYAKHVEMEALNAAGEGESAKAKFVVRDIADMSAKMLMENNKFRTRMFKETGLRVPVMGHGAMGMGMGGMMGGKGCGQMMGKGMMGGQMMGGAPAPEAQAPAAHSEHGN